MNFIRGYRIMMNLTQEEMAKKLNVSRQAYSEKERGNIPFNDVEKVKIKNIFREIDEEITIDKIFFNQKWPKVTF